MLHTIPIQMSEDIRKKVMSYATQVSKGEIPQHNLQDLQTQFTSLLTTNFRKRVPVVTAKRVAKELMGEYFENLVNEITYTCTPSK